MQIYLARNNQQAGPYTLEQVNQMLATGQVLLDDLAWHEGMPEWKKLGELTGGQLVYSPLATQAIATDPVISLEKNWATHAKAPVSTLDDDLAQMDKRFAAKVIDLLLLWIPLVVVLLQSLPESVRQQITKIQGGAFFPSPEQQQQVITLLSKLPEQTLASAGMSVLVYLIGYYALQAFLLKKSGQTIGKKLLGIRIVDEQSGKKTTLVRSFLVRSLAFVVIANLLTQPLSMLGGSGLIVYIVDYAFAFSARRQTLHDRLARTVVVTAKPEQLDEK